MDIEQLAQELEMLKNDNLAAKEEKRMGGFIDKYGSKFNGNTDIANLILAEMDRRGVSEASEAASSAVQEVLDKLRQEATTILDETKGAMQQVSDLMDKITDIQESVDAAQNGEAPGGDIGAAPPPDMGAISPPEGDMGAAPPPPPEGDMGAVPPVEAGVPPPEGDMSAMPPAEAMGELPPPTGEEVTAPPPPIGEIPSDVRLKNIKAKFQSFAASRKAPATVPSDKNVKHVWRPSKGMLEGVRGLI
jgi:hypothetical protein